MNCNPVVAICKNCKFWNPIEGKRRDAIIGSCRRNPPLGSVGDGAPGWANTMLSDWCGEFAPFRVVTVDGEAVDVPIADQSDIDGQAATSE